MQILDREDACAAAWRFSRSMLVQSAGGVRRINNAVFTRTVGEYRNKPAPYLRECEYELRPSRES